MLTAAAVERGAHVTAIRASRALTGLGMAYMLLAVVFGSSVMSGM